MENLGSYLQNLRTASGISFDQIWDEIRISKSNIELIEMNQLLQLGDYGFCKALVFNYARYLGADVDEVMREFYILRPEHTKDRFKPQESVKEKKIMLSTNFFWTLGIVIFVMILGAILYSTYLNGYLKPPVLFMTDAQEETPSKNIVVETKPDSLREHMRMLTDVVNKGTEKPIVNNVKPAKKSRFRDDTTDYVGEQLGDSPINVGIN